MSVPLIGLLALAVVFLFVDNYVLDDRNKTAEVAATKSTAEPATTRDSLPNSVAVLPFENLSPDPDNAYFAAGIHESTLNQLAKIRDLVVIARTSVLQYEEDPPPIPEIAKALKVETVMEGSVRYANGRVLITAQLIDGRTGAHLWSDEFNRELVDVFAVQAEVAEHIASAMQVQLLPDELVRIENRPTESTEAYQHYLHALSLPEPAIFPTFLPAKIELLERTIAADPEFAEAYAELAGGYYFRRDRQQARLLHIGIPAACACFSNSVPTNENSRLRVPTIVQDALSVQSPAGRRSSPRFAQIVGVLVSQVRPHRSSSGIAQTETSNSCARIRHITECPYCRGA